MSRDIIGKTIDNYRVEHMVGQGGMAAVYEVTDIQLERRVAMKVMHDHLAAQRAFRDMFVREAQSASRLDHPNIVRVYGFNITGEYLYIVMELVTGSNLRRYVKELAGDGRFIDFPEAAEIIRQLAVAMHYAHDQGMTHRDLKPDNVMLKPLTAQTPGLDYRPIITDFGLAQLTTVGTSAETMQQPIGTYPYMSPEQVNAEPVDRRTDIYALGIMLYELSVGRLPFKPKTLAEATKVHIQERLPLPSEFVRDYPQPLEEIVVRCLEKDREDRYSSAAELAGALADFIRMGDAPQSRLAQYIQRDIQETAPMEKQDDIHHSTVPPTPTFSDVTAERLPSRPEPTQEPQPDLVLPEPDESSGIFTEMRTVEMGSPLPEQPPEEVPEARRAPEQRYFDCLFVRARNGSFVFPLRPEQNLFQIGREAVDDLYLTAETVSRQHAQLERKPNGIYYLVDNGALNGTYVGNRRLEPGREVILRERTTVRIGNYWIELVIGEERRIQTVPDADEYATDAGYAPVSEGEPTQLMGIVPANAFPKVEPPKLTPEQIVNDRLIIYHESEPPRILLLREAQYVIGRATDNDIVLTGEYVSRRHARITRRGDFIYIHDLSALNGTWFDQERLESGAPHRLNASRIIRIGDYYMLFEAGRNLGGASISTGAEVSAAVPVSGLRSAGAARDDTYDDSIDTVAMVRPLLPNIPDYSVPVLSREVRASDHLIFISEDHPVQVVKLDKEVLAIGRASTQDVRLQGRRISREHVVIELRSNGNIYVTDTGSRNGVWLDDVLLVTGTQVLWQKHEVMRLANYWVKFERGVGTLDPFSVDKMDPRGLMGKAIGNYRVDRYVGESNLSAVYGATDIQLERDVALRVMRPDAAADPDLRQRFLEEARALSRLDHPNVITVMSYNELEGELFMVMELITGGTLRSVLIELSDRGTRLELGQALDISVQLANGLHYAHQQGLIHHDIKPDSITLKAKAIIGPIKDYTPILTNFAVSDEIPVGNIYQAEGDISDYAYFSPEQCLGESIDPRSDIYGLGTTVYELFTGRPPFQPRSVQEAVRMHTRETPTPPSELRPDLPRQIELVILRALQKNPEDRYQTAIDFARALQSATTFAAQEGAVFADGTPLVGTFPTDDVQATAIMGQALPNEIPLMTEPPRPEGEVDYDRLVFFSENAPTEVIDVDQPVLTVGRGEDQQVRLLSEFVSQRHARIERNEEGTYRIQDVQSTNGTYLGNYRLVPRVVEVWKPDQTVRLGDYWVRIETREYLEQDKLGSVRQGAAPSPADGDDEYQTDAGVSTLARPRPAHDRIGVKVSSTTVTVRPGSSATLSVEVVNQGDAMEAFLVDVVGLPSGWVTQTADQIDLMPYNRQTTSVTFHPPLASTSSEGSHAFEVRVRARTKQIDAVFVQGTLVVVPFYAFSTELYPERLRNQGRLELSIRNTGNTHSTYDIATKDREWALKFSLEGGAQYTIAPGHTETVNLRVAPRQRPLLGQPRFYAFDVSVSPANDAAGGPQNLPGEIIVTSRFALWMVILPLILLALFGASAGGAFYLDQQSAFAERTQIALANQTQAVQTATAVVLADDDNDRLSNAREAELGTDPNTADTDGDGLDDGAEVLSWSTAPLNRDTDGDNLTDGEEVFETGTNPLRVDTDNDGLSDSLDDAPTTRSTPTITPFPTIPGTDGDICPGSPTPSRLEVGMRALAAPSGVPNRLRDAPGLEGEVLGTMEQEEDFIVLEGPVCGQTDSIRWWYVDYQGLQAWAAEGEGNQYYLEPPSPEDSAPNETTRQDSGGVFVSRMNADQHILQAHLAYQHRLGPQ